jgi:hypothetical protein
MTVSKAKRESLPKSDFGLPSKAKGEAKGKPGNYPIDTEKRARNALSRVSQHGTSAEKATVRRRVAKKYPGIDVSTPKKEKK